MAQQDKELWTQENINTSVACSLSGGGAIPSIYSSIQQEGQQKIQRLFTSAFSIVKVRFCKEIH